MNHVSYFQIGDHFRRTINGKADCCALCKRPERFDAVNGQFVKQDHVCFEDTERATGFYYEDGYNPKDENTGIGARLGRGFVMRHICGDY